MASNKNEPTKWRSEQLRDERRARLARMKGKDGGKKQIQSGNTRFRLIMIAILVVALLLTTYWVLLQTGVMARATTALRVGDHSFKAAEISYFYRSLLQQYGVDPNTPEGQSVLNGPGPTSEDPTKTFANARDYVLDQAAQQARQLSVWAAKARAEGLTLKDADRAQIDSVIAQYRNQARQNSQTLENFLIRTFGRGMNVDILSDIAGMSMLASKYQTRLVSSYTFTPDQLQQTYEQDRDYNDVIKYHLFTSVAQINSDASETDKVKAKEAARAKANEMKEKLTDEASFRTIAATYATTDSDKKAFEDPAEDPTLHEESKRTILIDIENWLLANERKAGDHEVISGDTNSYVVWFVSRGKKTEPVYDVRHILVAYPSGTPSEEQKKAAMDKAQSILAEYNAGPKTEDSFAELAAKYSEDPGSADNGGLYTNVAKGYMVPTFEEWSLNSARKHGDTGIVESEHGLHVMYFVGTRETWQAEAIQILASNQLAEYEAAEVNKVPYSWNSLGKMYVN